MEDLLFGGTLLTAFLGGLVALLAPCCVSVMLPAYLATGFRRRTGILAATFVFAAGVATVIVPIGLGATALVSLVSGQHVLVFSAAATAMLAGGTAMLLGRKPRLPMLPGRAPTGGGFGSIYGLGVFSGAASSCCAPVLAGVAVLSGATASFPAALAVALTYVLGMVAPLAALALVWDRKDWSKSRWLQGRQVTLRLGRLRRTMPFGTAASAFLLIDGRTQLRPGRTGPRDGIGRGVPANHGRPSACRFRHLRSPGLAARLGSGRDPHRGSCLPDTPGTPICRTPGLPGHIRR
ncbi:cytochrome c biogenesis CcdA family protein [Arthrobacter cavernae]|uniref:Cytochrome c biogenesis protein CcdA n=1 Tax=Arthrobacter cavernae TaxID=2817681 RepID=A0A939HGV0_9MICC|nr:cytochrome c biogenesis protein CcdA [Arthrobacter cavernae]MBO1269676.1 cytochrome c biogenesis protein CcdA [Arthrobacter cavernae]